MLQEIDPITHRAYKQGPGAYPGPLTLLAFFQFFKQCVELRISDIVLNGDDLIIGERHSRAVQEILVDDDDVGIFRNIFDAVVLDFNALDVGLLQLFPEGGGPHGTACGTCVTSDIKLDLARKAMAFIEIELSGAENLG